MHVEANVGRITVCAEPIAIGMAISEGERQFDTIVAVGHPGPRGRKAFQVVSPCGMCRELVVDYGKDTRVIISANGKLQKVYMRDLLPHKSV